MKIRDVAKAAGVSIATVSRVINHPEKVTDETREKIRAIIAQNNYIPNGEPKAPRKIRKKNSIAVIVPSLSLYRSLSEGISSICSNKNYSLLQCETGGNEKTLQTCLKSLFSQQIDGMILDTSCLNSHIRELLTEEGIPFVCIGGKKTALDVNCCYINYYDTAEKTAGLLQKNPADTALLLTAFPGSDIADQMEKGFRSVWKNSVTVRSAGNSPLEGFQFMQEYLLQNPAPDVVFTQTDELALGVIKAAQEAGISVPGAMRVAGFDNASFSSFTDPEITSTEQPTYRLGMLAARMLFDILLDEDYFDIEAQEIALKGRLKIRQSCGNKKAIYQEYE